MPGGGFARLRRASAAWNRPGDLAPVLSCSILPSRARSCRASDGGCLHHFTALQSPKGAVGLSMVQLDLGSCSFQHFMLLDDVCAALKRSVKSWSDGTQLYELCTANNLHVNKAR